MTTVTIRLHQPLPISPGYIIPNKHAAIPPGQYIAEKISGIIRLLYDGDTYFFKAKYCQIIAPFAKSITKPYICSQ